jgi:hypothetical protein
MLKTRFEEEIRRGIEYDVHCATLVLGRCVRWVDVAKGDENIELAATNTASVIGAMV